jgi:hypothetical protein
MKTLIDSTFFFHNLFFASMNLKQLLKTIFISCCFIFPTISTAQWYSFNDQAGKPVEPAVSLISHDRNSTVIKIDLLGINRTKIQSEKDVFDQFDLLNDIFIHEAGQPGLPYVAKIIGIPDHASVSFEILDIGQTITLTGINHLPARESWVEGAFETEFIKNEDTYQNDHFFPGQYIHVESPSVFRDLRITRVSIFPVQYNPVRQEVQMITSLTVRINYGKGEVINPKTAPRKSIAPSFGALYRSTIFNYQEILDSEYGGREDGEEVLLYIIPDNFYSYFEEYLQWKRLSGWKVIVTKFSEINANASNPNTILNHISNLYFMSQDPPTYVILVGDDGVFPKKIVTFPNYSFPDEDFFVKVDGIDFFPDMFVGRIPNLSADKLQLMLKKFMMYEKTPFMQDTTWFRRGICCSNNEYVSQIETKRFTAQMMMNFGNFLSVDTLMSNGVIGSSQGCTVNLNMILAAINNGRGFLNYRGEGWSSGWWANCYPFSTSQVNNVQNGEKFTFVTSIGCGVSMFNASGGNCFGEQWLKLGTVDNPRGAVNFIGPTSNSHTAYNNRIDKGIYIGMFQEGMNTPAQALLRGKLLVYQDFGISDPMVEYHYNVYCDLGDPSTRIWKTTPRLVTALHPQTIETGTSSFDVEVDYLSTGFPAINANINISGNNIFVNKRTNNFGKSNFSVTCPLPDTLTVTITGDDIYPHYSTIFVVPSTQSVHEQNNSDADMLRNHPNPFTLFTEISFNLDNASSVNIEIYDQKGAYIYTLLNEDLSPGTYNLLWDGTDQKGNTVKAGVYYAIFKTDDRSKSIQMIKLK